MPKTRKPAAKAKAKAKPTSTPLVTTGTTGGGLRIPAKFTPAKPTQERVTGPFPIHDGSFLTVTDGELGEIRLRAEPLNPRTLEILLRAALSGDPLPWPKKLVNESGKVLWSTRCPLHKQTLYESNKVFLLTEIA